MGVRSAKTEKVKRLRKFEGKLFGRPDSPPQVPLAPGNCVLVFSARARNFSEGQGPKRGPKTTKALFPTGGGLTEKNVAPEKEAGKHPPRLAR